MTSQETYQQLADILSREGLDVNQISSILGMPLETAIILAGLVLSVIIIWSLIWKGLALWKSAKSNHKIWFIIILIINTVGILEILYIYVFSKIKLEKSKEKIKKPMEKSKKKFI